jgi:hypothetical protein
MLPRHEGVGRLVRRDGGITRPTPPGARGRPGFGGRFAVALSGPGLVREGGGAGAGAASRLRRGARPGRIFMRLSFCGLWTQNDERVGLGGPSVAVRRPFVRHDDRAGRRPVVVQPPPVGPRI